jgi:ribonuclease Y
MAAFNPQRIEEVVAKVQKQLEETDHGNRRERTVIELGIHGLAPALVRMVGRMRFRSSYGQNLLKHSVETRGKLCRHHGCRAGYQPDNQIKMAKRAGLLHDIGKVAEQETELSHALIGMKMYKQHGEHPVIINAVGAHHDEIEMNNIISPIIQACDAISGARPGARREILENYLKRIGELEELAMGYEGVAKAFAMQAGRELRVIVEADKVTDQYADDLSLHDFTEDTGRDAVSGPDQGYCHQREAGRCLRTITRGYKSLFRILSPNRKRQRILNKL